MKMRSDNVQAVWLADPREVRIAELEAELEAVKAEKKA